MANYEKHVVAFIDFLGTREALRDKDRTEKILNILKLAAQFSGNFQATSTADAAGGRISQFRPAISAFSDNIVVSYPISGLAAHGSDMPIALIFMRTLVGYIAWNAFSARLLIRGGIAVGDLFHDGGVAYGPALVEAYEVEQKVAVYPRIAFGMSIAQHEGFKNWSHNFSQGEDGVQMLSYMDNFVYRIESNMARANVEFRPWIAEVRDGIATELAKFTEAKHQPALAKWTWFANQFEKYCAYMEPTWAEIDKAKAEQGQQK